MVVAGQQPLQDTARLEALQRYSATDLRAEASFDRLTRLASKMLDAPIALVNILDDEKQFCKSAFGMEAEDASNLPNNLTFCWRTVATNKPYVVGDLTKDTYLKDNPFVTGQPGIRSYLGIPLQTEDGYAIGTLCVLDLKVREWEEIDINTLRDLAATVMIEIDLRAQMIAEQEALMDKGGFDPDRRDDTPTHVPIKEITSFGRYQLIKHLDSGGMCDVYLCRHQSLKTPVAVKILKYHNAQDKSFRERFELEGKIIASLKHPNIVRVFDAGNIGHNYYISMEYISGLNLKDYIKQHAPLPLSAVVSIAQDIAEALDYAHSYDVIHRDVKPSNVMLRTWKRHGQQAYQATLMDFGVARMIGGNTDLTGENAVGTIDYIAPEQITSSSTVTPAADLYAFAVMVYEMLTGELPFQAETAAALLFERISQEPPDPRQLRPSIPEHIANALRRALLKDPQARYADMASFMHALSHPAG